jgi:hypothetical protein
VRESDLIAVYRRKDTALVPDRVLVDGGS